MIIERQSVVEAPAGQVWARVVTPEGINDEVRPSMTMSMLRGAESLTVDKRELDRGRGFDERSTMMSMRRWRHQCTVTPDGDSKAIVRDRITFQLRAPLRPVTPIVAAGLRVLFGPRHRRLQRHFAGSQRHEQIQ
jgi:ligand-binding SRPBCC domain-containing protein